MSIINPGLLVACVQRNYVPTMLTADVQPGPETGLYAYVQQGPPRRSAHNLLQSNSTTSCSTYGP